jgi:hypothetical protein
MVWLGMLEAELIFRKTERRIVATHLELMHALRQEAATKEQPKHEKRKPSGWVRWDQDDYSVFKRSRRSFDQFEGSSCTESVYTVPKHRAASVEHADV